MSAIKVLRRVCESGFRLSVDGADLILDTEVEPPVDVVDAIRCHKADIIQLLAPTGDKWTVEDWRAFYEERASLAEFDGGKPRAEAEVTAFEWCIVEWLNRHPESSNPGHCAWCESPDQEGSAVVPFGTESYGHTWLHPECWKDWDRDRRERGQQALAAIGLNVPPNYAKGVEFPIDFRENGGGHPHG